jgi:hypothetical protein
VWRTSTVWWRERVGRTSMVVEVGTEKERAYNVDPVEVGEAVGEGTGVDYVSMPVATDE